MNHPITDPYWTVRCESVGHKRALFDLAARCGVPLAPLPSHCVPYRNDRDLTIAFLATAQGAGLMSRRTAANDKGRVRPPTHSADDFVALCEEYATTTLQAA